MTGCGAFSLTGIFFAMNIAMIGFYQSVEMSMKALVFTLLRGVIVLVPMFFTLAAVFPKWGMWGASPSSEAITLIVILITFAVSRRRGK